jgi:hypothetical protein
MFQFRHGAVYPDKARRSSKWIRVGSADNGAWPASAPAGLCVLVWRRFGRRSKTGRACQRYCVCVCCCARVISGTLISDLGS